MYKLPKLQYPFSAFEPYIDKQTMEIHYGKHHAAYVNNLNLTLEKYPKYANLEVDELLNKIAKVPNSIKKAVRNFGGGHANHSLFWTTLSPKKQEPQASVLLAINSTFSSVDSFKEIFSKTALTLFGSGWVWLVVDKKKKVSIMGTANQDSPLSKGKTPILNLDVWEHAYYLKYQNRRADYIQAWWNVVNWNEVERIYRKALK